jgi:hypothetical protein
VNSLVEVLDSLVLVVNSLVLGNIVVLALHMLDIESHNLELGHYSLVRM